VEEGDSAMSRIESANSENQAGVSLEAAGTRVVVRFSREGSLAASLQIADGPKEILGSEN
jgi:hypothetical protein